MRINFDQLLSMVEFSRQFAMTARQHGYTPHQAAAHCNALLAAARTQSERDQILALYGAEAGWAIRSERDLIGTLDWGLKELGPQDTRDQRAEAIAQQVRANGNPEFTAAQVKALFKITAQGDLQQGLSGRMNASDRQQASMREPARELPEHMRHARDDRRDRVATVIGAAHGAVDHSLPLRIKVDDSASMRDTLRAAFDASDEREAQNDPLTDYDLRQASNAV